MKELTKRVLTAAVGIPAAVFLIYAGGFVFAGTVMIVSTFALIEYYKIPEKKGAKPHKFIGVAASLFFQASIYFILTRGSFERLSFIDLMVFMILADFKASQPL